MLTLYIVQVRADTTSVLDKKQEFFHSHSVPLPKVIGTLYAIHAFTTVMGDWISRVSPQPTVFLYHSSALVYWFC